MRLTHVASVAFGRSLFLAAGALCLSTVSFAQVGISVDVAPPELPVYEQPMCPGDGYIWTPGYWAWGDGAYYWVSGDWVMAPEAGFLWTPGYWGWRGSGFFFNEGYWGLGVGFYGGINYGFGYFGRGYDGGHWDNGHFFYNTAYNRVNAGSVRNVYNARVNEAAGGRVSYNGGKGGIEARATPQEEAAASGRHAGPVAAQTQHAQAARSAPQQRPSANHDATPGGRSEDSARGGTAIHPKELPPIAHSAAPNTGNSKLDQRYQKQQDQLSARQNQERQKLQQQQDKEHRQQAGQAKSQQMEQRHQQQTQQMQQRHTQQSQQMQRRQSAGGGGSRGGGGGHH
ncbi:MAG: YXWGXW repeat-containing protein [Bryobacteraceae bacterium]|jgi:hypothetical protein